LVDADDVNMLGEIRDSIQLIRGAFLDASKEIGLEVNAGKTKYMVMSGDQNAGRSHNITIDNGTFERVEEFKYLGTTLTSQNSIQEEIRNRLKLGNACYYPVQNLLIPVCYPKNYRLRYTEL
jgi:hypothetical protein